MILDLLDRGTAELLARFAFDADLFEDLQRRVRTGELSSESNPVRGDVEPPLDEDVTPFPGSGEAPYEDALEAGTEALRAGRVAQIVLAGGMATRFGGVVKAVLDAVDGRSFLEAKLTQTASVERSLRCEVPIALMTSFATDDAVRTHVVERGLGDPLVFSQSVSLRLDESGELFREEDGRPSPYAPGHGDLFGSLRRAGVPGSLGERGVEVVTVSNVDNLGARVDPVVIGMHLLAGRPLTCEVARKEGDLGGAPARVDGRLQVLEGPRFPAGFDQDRIPVFNTNTAVFDLAALAREYELTWLYVRKNVGDRPAVQLERVYHEASRHVPTTYLEVPRRGRQGRFLPIKTPDDLVAAQAELRELVGRRTSDP